MTASDRPLDIVLYGASGHTGRQMANYLANSQVRFALAGRSSQKLKQIARRLAQAVFPPGVITAASDDVRALSALAQKTKVVLSAAGPYAPHGEPLIAACARHGTHYADICAETVFVRRLIDRYHAQAAQNGARIVPFCGFDSVPSDLGTLLLVEHLRSSGQSCRGVRGFFRLCLALNGGSAATARSMLTSSQLPHRQDPMLLNPADARDPDQAGFLADPVAPEYDPDLGSWVAPYFMSPVNTRVVRRSHALKEQWGTGYGPGFSYQEFLAPRGPLSLVTSTTIAWSMLAAETAALFPGTAALWRILGPGAGQGPPEWFSKNGYFQCRMVGTGDDGSKAWLTMAARADPSNEVTVKMACQAALCLAFDGDRLPGGVERGGVLTPATAMGTILSDRLRQSGITVALDQACQHVPGQAAHVEDQI